MPLIRDSAATCRTERRGVSVALNLSPKDEYSHQGLAELYLRWAKARASQDPAESAAYITKCEEIIRKGLAVARDKEALYIVSGDLVKFLGDSPGHIAALRQAVADAPDSLISKYLLGMALRRQGELKDAFKVLQEGLLTKPDDHCLARAAALVARDLKEPYDAALALLNLASVSGAGDAEFLPRWADARDVREFRRRPTRSGVGQDSSRGAWRLVTGFLISPMNWTQQSIGGMGASGTLMLDTDSLLVPVCRTSLSIRAALDESSSGPALKLEFRPGFSVRGPVAWAVRLPTA